MNLQDYISRIRNKFESEKPWYVETNDALTLLSIVELQAKALIKVKSAIMTYDEVADAYDIVTSTQSAIQTLLSGVRG